ncbi:helix-turn-helix domain-containing protein [Pseudoalteromonas piscicida]|uniref:AraC family transcriptional regulator n=2 Tax=Pseudoalteromonas piscicida TaxID=43662 RepID=A0A2A5JQP1_PSEO7|nr:AraC family transcriptional regulator [Pseudoalteromonas piscicida]PCK31738.1 AraC family transcriptional regulator [Pseudoalteromonas piscicida]
MTIEHYYLFLLGLCCTLVIAQLFVKEKRAAHILFALVCGSIALATTKKLTKESLDGYEYLIGIGACLTCNGFWLFSRALFRKTNAISNRHIAIAVLIAALIIWQQGYLFVHSQFQLTGGLLLDWLNSAAIELTIMLSSCVLLLAFWEGCRGFSESREHEKAQRAVFLLAYFICVAGTKLIANRYAGNLEVQEWAVTSAAVLILLTAQALLYWRYVYRFEEEAETITCEPIEKMPTEQELVLRQRVERLLITEQAYLKEGLKVADVAQQLNESEYKISRVIRQQLQARNFNQLINRLRVEHAKTLLQDSSKQHWPVLVVGLESGFASVGPFTRAFKIETGVTPNQFRKRDDDSEHVVQASE